MWSGNELHAHLVDRGVQVVTGTGNNECHSAASTVCLQEEFAAGSGNGHGLCHLNEAIASDLVAPKHCNDVFMEGLTRHLRLAVASSERKAHIGTCDGEATQGFDIQQVARL